MRCNAESRSSELLIAPQWYITESVVLRYVPIFRSVQRTHHWTNNRVNRHIINWATKQGTKIYKMAYKEVEVMYRNAKLGGK